MKHFAPFGNTYRTGTQFDIYIHKLTDHHSAKTFVQLEQIVGYLEVEAIGTESASRRSVEEELTCHIRCFPVERFAVGLPKTLPGAEHIRWDAA